MDRIAVVVGADSASVQALLARMAAGWRASDAAVVGLTAQTHELADRTCEAGFLRDLVSGAAYPMYLEVVRASTSCHLDAAGVEAACAAVLGQIPESDLVVLSKFGKLEAGHSGLVPAFEAAFAAGKPILTSVSGRHRDAWRGYAPGAVELPAEEAVLEQWWRSLDRDEAAARRARLGAA